MAAARPDPAREAAPAATEHPCANCAFHRKSIWQPLETENVPALAAAFVRREFAEGEAIFEQDAPSHGLFCVSRGLIAVKVLHENGGSTLFRLAFPGDLVGVRAFVRGQPHRTEARALMASRICTVAQQPANRLVKTSPPMLLRLAERCVDEVDQMQERFLSTTFHPGLQHLAELLVRLVQVYAPEAGNEAEIRLPLSRADIGDVLRVQPETVSRLFARLQRQRLIEKSGRRVTIRDMAMLVRAAAGA